MAPSGRLAGAQRKPSPAGANDGLPPPSSSLYGDLRILRRAHKSIFNRLCSIDYDAQFVCEIRSQFFPPTFPLVANLRCGRWYAPAFDATAYYKSTDGHPGEWDFSVQRLNLHVAMLAASCGGCLIVDSTRKGRTLPDSFSKTIPIWCAVLNRAVHRHRAATNASLDAADCGTPLGSSRVANSGCWSSAIDSQSAVSTVREIDNGCDRDDDAPLSDDGNRGDPWSARDLPWDESLHTPAFVSASEHEQITALLDSFVDKLLRCGADIAALSAVLCRPLRPLWVTTKSRFSTSHSDIKYADLGFIPIVCVSTSEPVLAGTAAPMKSILIGLSPLHPSVTPGTPVDPRLHSTTGDDLSINDVNLLASANANGAVNDAGGGSMVVPFAYVQGAGDDEELWSHGLTASLFWLHRHVLLSAGAANCEGLVRRIVASGACVAVDRGVSIQESDRAHFVGLQPARDGSQGGAQWATPASFAWIGDTGVAIGLSSAASELVSLAAVEAGPSPLGLVVDCDGPSDHIASTLTCDNMCRSSTLVVADSDGATLSTPVTRVHLGVGEGKKHRGALCAALLPASQAVRDVLASGKRVLVCCATGTDTSVAVVLAALLYCRDVRCSWLGGGNDNPTRSPQAGAVCVDSVENPCHGVRKSSSDAGWKVIVSRALTQIAATWPVARPSRGALKIVRQFLMDNASL
eukprot:Opistho-2@3579